MQIAPLILKNIASFTLILLKNKYFVMPDSDFPEFNRNC